MLRRYRWRLFFIGLMIVLLAVWLFDPASTQSKRLLKSLIGDEEAGKMASKLAIFSWSSKEVAENREQLRDDLTEYGFARVFQSFPSRMSNKEVAAFAEAMAERDIDVYGLTGTPEWALDPTGKSMIKRLDRLAEVNRMLPEEKRIKGFVMDVEPYGLANFDWNDRAIQNSYVSGMKQLYAAAEREGLELIVVVPYFYDTKGYQDVVRTIIREASSEVAVMNYYRNHEIDHLAYEAQVAKEAGKPITTIYEFKRPGEHKLIDKNTYFNAGRAAAEENARELIRHFDGQEVRIAYHDYKAFREVLNNE